LEYFPAENVLIQPDRLRQTPPFLLYSIPARKHRGKELQAFIIPWQGGGRQKEQQNEKIFSLAEPAGTAELKPRYISPPKIAFSFLCVLCGLEQSGREKSLCLSQSQQGVHPIITTFSRGYRERFL
jgi:hypothetical protein